MKRRFYQMSCLVALFGLFGLSVSPALGEEPSYAGTALSTVFSPQRAPEQKTMGLLQRSFLDMVEESRDKLEVALVIDGTDSMGADIDGVRKALHSMVEDLRRYRGDRVSFSLVVYRDLGAPSGAVSIPLKQFTNELEVLSRAFDLIVPETGAPYFYEATDLGVQQALSELPWSSDETTTRWLLVFGDAPPYDADFEDTVGKTGARRYYDTDLLTRLAARKGIRISCILCTSTDNQREVYNQVLDKTRGFMNALATNTGGLMLDLSYPDIRQALIESAKQPEMETQEIGQITRQDVLDARQGPNQVALNARPNQPISIAVLPFLPLSQMSFDPTLEGVQIATEMRMKLRNAPNTHVKSPVDVRREIRRLRSSPEDKNKWLQELALRLRVDYVIWGIHKRARGIVQVKSAVYSKENGQETANAELTTGAVPEVELAGRLTMALASNSGRPIQDRILAASFSSISEPPQVRQAMLTPVADDPAQRGDLLIGLESLEQAMGHEIGTPESKELLDTSLARLTKVAERNAFAHLLLASCHYNLAQHHTKLGDADRAAESAQQYDAALKRAYRYRLDLKHDNLIKEVEADYALLRKEYAQAIDIYEQLAQTRDDSRLNSALRAHWMLTGIYSGDWGVPQEIVDPVKARSHMIQILAHWDDSSEARIIKLSLRWEEESGKTRFQHVPRRNNLILAGLVDAE